MTRAKTKWSVPRSVLRWPTLRLPFIPASLTEIILTSERAYKLFCRSPSEGTSKSYWCEYYTLKQKTLSTSVLPQQALPLQTPPPQQTAESWKYISSCASKSFLLRRTASRFVMLQCFWIAATKLLGQIEIFPLKWIDWIKIKWKKAKHLHRAARSKSLVTPVWQISCSAGSSILTVPDNWHLFIQL